ncbi:MerR family transcriptional regulator [Actinomadura sp. ATCC 31491]|uniref:MerR family transcriptional regulator n=1 Tax=Actinomadura luzonensis TaxID=2805427 RepID=A0ABT0G6S1_9ACTN|nr:MerR family transcriptional regulator [Actinomadura luzonensis]MCK2220310.1 MerR family transcriptional regulator [Actinomadura luzonensis]
MSEEEAGYGIGAVSRLLGVPAPTLRTWNLRYGLGPSRRSAGGHRRYDSGDLDRLREMQRLIAEGLPPSEAARRARRARTATPPAGSPAAAAPGSTTPASTTPATTATASTATASTATGGATALVRAAYALDSHAVTALLDAALAAEGVRSTWERLVLPAFDAVCRRQDGTGAGIDVEHLLSDRLLAALHGHALRQAPGPRGRRPVLLACAEEEQHTLPVHALSAALAEEGVETRLLGARTPYAALAHAMRRLHPAAVFLWSQQESTGDTAPLAGLPRLRPAARLVLGGRGWPETLPAGVIRVDTFREALSQIRRTLP